MHHINHDNMMDILMEYDDNIPSDIHHIIMVFIYCIHENHFVAEVPHSLHWIHCECGYLLPGRGGHGSGGFADAEPLASCASGWF